MEALLLKSQAARVDGELFVMRTAPGAFGFSMASHSLKHILAIVFFFF